MTDKTGFWRGFKVQKFKNNVKVNNLPPDYFIKSAWDRDTKNGQVSLWYGGYRVAFLFYFIFCLTASILRDPDRHVWYIWATNISLLVQTFYAFIFATTITHRLVQQLRRQDSKGEGLLDPSDQKGYSDSRLKTMDSVTFFLLNLTGTFPYIVTIAFWMFVDSDKKPGTILWYFTDHGVNALLALVDTLIVAMPVRLATVVYTLMTSFVYLSFTALYEYHGGVYINEEEEPYIYPLLNWRHKPEWAMFNCLMAVIATIVFHVVMWLLYKLRLVLVTKVNSRRNNKEVSLKVGIDKEFEESLQPIFVEPEK